MGDYYHEHSKEFIEDTFSADMSEQYCFFEKYLNRNGTILDIGLGSGRDSLYFKSKGYEVYAIDPEEEFVKHAMKMGLSNVFCLKAQDMEFDCTFDGIWACASLLHIGSNELKNVFVKCHKALKSNGIMYVSFKYGNFEGERSERYYIDLDERTILNFLVDTGLKVLDYYISQDVRPNRKDKWLNVILLNQSEKEK